MMLRNFNTGAAIRLILSCAFFVSCSQPVLESSECFDSRDTVKKFYSFHIGNEMENSSGNLEKRKKYLSVRLFDELQAKTDSSFDYFTQTEKYPKAFRAGKCQTVGDGRTSFEVLLFWRNNDKDVQRLIRVEAVNENAQWHLDRVSSAE